MKKSLLKSKLKQIFLKHKLSKNHAEICSNYLVKAEILDAKGHGLARLKMYCDRIKAKVINPKPKIKIKKISSSVSYIDADNSIKREKDLLRNDLGDIDVARIFTNLSRSGRDEGRAEIIALLKHIRYNVYDNTALIRNGFDVGGQQHSQLWFLPTTLRGKGVVDKIMGKLISVIMTAQKNETCKWFRDHFCFIPMHSGKANKENYEGIELGNNLSESKKCYTKNKRF